MERIKLVQFCCFSKGSHTKIYRRNPIVCQFPNVQFSEQTRIWYQFDVLRGKQHFAKQDKIHSN